MPLTSSLFFKIVSPLTLNILERLTLPPTNKFLPIFVEFDTLKLFSILVLLDTKRSPLIQVLPIIFAAKNSSIISFVISTLAVSCAKVFPTLLNVRTSPTLNLCPPPPVYSADTTFLLILSIVNLNNEFISPNPVKLEGVSLLKIPPVSPKFDPASIILPKLPTFNFPNPPIYISPFKLNVLPIQALLFIVIFLPTLIFSETSRLFKKVSPLILTLLLTLRLFSKYAVSPTLNSLLKLVLPFTVNVLSKQTFPETLKFAEIRGITIPPLNVIDPSV